jgi:hypothetical protein
MTQRKRQYHPGERAPMSGKYEARHVEHRSSHQVLILRGEELPTCRTCKAGVRFMLIEPINHVRHDMDFAGAAVA